MELSELVLAAYSLALPFLNKTGEGVARKVGEDIWNIIKSPFVSKTPDIAEKAVSNAEQFQIELAEVLSSNPELKEQLTSAIEKGQSQLQGNFQQNINSYGEVQKQVNIQNNTGDITM